MTIIREIECETCHKRESLPAEAHDDWAQDIPPEWFHLLRRPESEREPIWAATLCSWDCVEGFYAVLLARTAEAADDLAA